MARDAPSLRERALKALTRSEKGRSELERLLAPYGNPDDVRRLLDELARLDLQSDARAAHTLARNARKSGKTRSRALVELDARGIADRLATAAVAEIYGEGERAEAEDLAARAARLVTSSSSTKERQRAARHLMRKGFDPEAVAEACGLREGDSEVTQTHDEEA